MNKQLYKLGYVLNPLSKIWTKLDYTSINYNDGDSIEQRLKKIIAESKDISIFSHELKEQCIDWASTYHLSTNRSNLLRPFNDILNDADVLEIGAGCGALTRYLGECGANVVALEGSIQRAEIARSRTRDLKNVEVVAENFSNFQWDKKFDVITLIGVLEYANLFTQTDTPHLTLLKKVFSLLKPEGKLIIGIENQLGIKYFAGVPEDHLGVPMYGIEGRYKKNQPQTFGKNVISNLLKESGFKTVEFLAPLPDYKLPVSIITENGFVCDEFDAATLAVQTVRRDLQLPTHLTFSPELVIPYLYKNGIAMDLANSFLIVANNTENKTLNQNLLAYHFSTGRLERFCKETRFIKEDTDHINVQYQAIDTQNDYVAEKNSLLDFSFPSQSAYFSGKPLSTEFLEILTKDEWDFAEVGAFLQRYLGIVFSIVLPNKNIEIKSVNTKIPPECFDLVPQNIIIQPNGSWNVIDKEWVLKDNMSVGWLIFRTLLLQVQMISRFGKPTVSFPNTRKDFFCSAFKSLGLEISEKQLDLFGKLELEIQEEVSKSNTIDWGANAPLQFDNLNLLETKLNHRIIQLNTDLVEQDNLISNLNKNLSERKLEISNLNQNISNFNQTLSKRDQEISSLNQNISNLNQTLSKRDQEISSLKQNISSLNQTLSKRNQEISSLKQNLSKLDQEVIQLNQSIIERDQQIVGLNDEIFQRGEWGLRLDAELENTQQRLREEQERFESAIKSNSWRITLPLRETRLWLSKPKQQAKRYTKKSLKIIKELYQSRAYDIQTTEKHRKFFVKYAPNLLSFTETRFDGREKSPTSIKEIEESISNIPELPQNQIFFENSLDHIGKAKSIKINTSEDPLVSVIIPIYGKVGFTLNCLASIAANPPLVPFEVTIIDDNSPDESVKILKEIKNINLIENKQNQGFIRSCNIGAEKAKGKYLYFLNNDTQVTPDWMDELVRTFYELPETGLVGSKLIYPDGKLQEAGGIIWQDGSAWNFGRLQDPQLPVFNYAREVDYCSGASIMIPKEIFEEVGGFDEYYLPAYCEDSDLALKIRSKGYRVIYQPLSTIIHYEGISSGTDTDEGIKSYQIENSQKLYSRWKDVLATHQVPEIDVDNAKDRRAKHRVLVLEHCTPTPNQDAGSVTVFNLMLLLREMGFQVTFIPEDNFLYMPDYTTDLQRIGVEVLYAPYITSVEQHLKEYGERYDLAFLFRPKVVTRNIENIRQYCPKAKVLYYTHDLHFLRESREAELFQDAKTSKMANETKELELNAIKSCDASILVSNQELEIIKKELPDYTEKLHTLSLILNIPGTDKGFSDRKDIVFVGGFQHTPNTDAVQYFVSEIMPLVRQQLPGVRFYAVGSNPPDEIKALASDDVIITGFVEDLKSLLDKMRVSVAPLRYGAGVKGKVGTAMAAGLPVVATNIAAEGMLLKHGENIFVANEPKRFSKMIATLYKDEGVWNNLSQNGLEFARNEWGVEKVIKLFSNIIKTLEINDIENKYPLSFYYESDSPKKVKNKEVGKTVSV